MIGCPEPGYYGSNCSTACPDPHCRYCHLETGVCQGCQSGYKGHKCELGNLLYSKFICSNIQYVILLYMLHALTYFVKIVLINFNRNQVFLVLYMHCYFVFSNNILLLKHAQMVTSDGVVQTYATKHVQVVITSTVCVTLVVSQAGKETTAMNVNKHNHNTYTRGYQKVLRLMRYLSSCAYKFCREYKTTNVLSIVKI